MLKLVLMPFYEAIDEARAHVGDNAPRIADTIISRTFPESFEASEREGCDRMLRSGVINAVKRYIRKPPAEDRQRSLADIDPDFLPIADRLNSGSYFTPTIDGGEYKTIVDLIADPKKLDAARKFLRQKGIENINEADVLDELYSAVTEGRVHTMDGGVS